MQLHTELDNSFWDSFWGASTEPGQVDASTTPFVVHVDVAPYLALLIGLLLVLNLIWMLRRCMTKCKRKRNKSSEYKQVEMAESDAVSDAEKEPIKRGV